MNVLKRLKSKSVKKPIKLQRANNYRRRGKKDLEGFSTRVAMQGSLYSYYFKNSKASYYTEQSWAIVANSSKRNYPQNQEDQEIGE